MLKQRVITAVLMLAVLLPALFHPQPGVFAAVTLLLIVGGGWEWARLNGVPEGRSRLLGALLGGVLVLLWWAVGLQHPMPAVWLLAGLVCVSLGAFIAARPIARLVPAETAWGGIVREGLTICGWVGMWRPLEIHLYRWWPLLRR